MNKTPLYQKIRDIIKSGKEYKIVFIGDSLTSAEWVHPNWRDAFEYILKFSFEEFDGDDWWIPEWNLKFYNYSLDGASSRDFLHQVSIAEEEVNPDLFIIMGTSNDTELGISVQEHTDNLKKIFDLTQTQEDLAEVKDKLTSYYEERHRLETENQELKQKRHQISEQISSDQQTLVDVTRLISDFERQIDLYTMESQQRSEKKEETEAVKALETDEDKMLREAREEAAKNNVEL